MRDGQLSRTGPKILLVTKQSATETGVGGILNRDVVLLKGDHSSIIKFESEKDDGYQIVVNRLKDFLSGARLAIGNSSRITNPLNVPITQNHPDADLRVQNS